LIWPSSEDQEWKKSPLLLDVLSAYFFFRDEEPFEGFTFFVATCGAIFGGRVKTGAGSSYGRCGKENEKAFSRCYLGSSLSSYSLSTFCLFSGEPLGSDSSKSYSLLSGAISYSKSKSLSACW
jgi:hypothetical protein